ncbi:MAG: hypothetical protein Q7R81_05975 [Candidatus Peregrinibacteria bacterium]|nr:hypothetical protein [Candidatus Peregrinibacteria bacterium]
MEREIPKELSTNPRIDHFLRESFVAWSGNAPVERAQVLGFGDKHSDLDDALTLWALLGSMVRDEDILLVESTSDEKAQAHPLVMVLTKTGKHPTVHGWDDAKLAAEHDQAMHELHDLVKEANETRDITRHTVILRRVTAIKLRILRIGKKRNNRLLDYVSNARADDKRVFISAGLLHFAGESRWKPLLKDTPYLFLSPKAAFKTVSKLLKMEE